MWGPGGAGPGGGGRPGGPDPMAGGPQAPWDTRRALTPWRGGPSTEGAPQARRTGGGSPWGCCTGGQPAPHPASLIRVIIRAALTAQPLKRAAPPAPPAPTVEVGAWGDPHVPPRGGCGWGLAGSCCGRGAQHPPRPSLPFAPQNPPFWRMRTRGGLAGDPPPGQRRGVGAGSKRWAPPGPQPSLPLLGLEAITALRWGGERGGNNPQPPERGREPPAPVCTPP